MKQLMLHYLLLHYLMLHYVNIPLFDCALYSKSIIKKSAKPNHSLVRGKFHLIFNFIGQFYIIKCLNLLTM